MKYVSSMSRSRVWHTQKHLKTDYVLHDEIYTYIYESESLVIYFSTATSLDRSAVIFFLFRPSHVHVYKQICPSVSGIPTTLCFTEKKLQRKRWCLDQLYHLEISASGNKTCLFSWTGESGDCGVVTARFPGLSKGGWPSCVLSNHAHCGASGGDGAYQEVCCLDLLHVFLSVNLL